MIYDSDILIASLESLADLVMEVVLPNIEYCARIGSKSAEWCISFPLGLQIIPTSTVSADAFYEESRHGFHITSLHLLLQGLISSALLQGA